MWPDLINGGFELVGALFTWRNYLQLRRDRHVAGVYWPTTAFFAAWGIWNLVYYPALEQWASFAGGVALVAGNLAWVVLAVQLKQVDMRERLCWRLMAAADHLTDLAFNPRGRHTQPLVALANLIDRIAAIVEPHAERPAQAATTANASRGVTCVEDLMAELKGCSPGGRITVYVDDPEETGLQYIHDIREVERCWDRQECRGRPNMIGIIVTERLAQIQAPT